MKRSFFVAVLSVMLGFAIFSGSMAVAKDGGSLKSVAIISLTVSDVGGSVKASSLGSNAVSDLIDASLNAMLADAETKLGSKWTVVKAATFMNNAAYLKAGVEKTLTVYVPKMNGKEMPVFTQASKEIKGGIIDADKAKELCKALNVDGIVLIFSEWASKTGGIIPTTKAMTKNVLSVYDANGKQVIKERADMLGNKSLGGFGVAAVNKETIEEWRDAYGRALDKIVASL